MSTYDDPKLLGEALVLGAHTFYGRGETEKLYDCRGQQLRYSTKFVTDRYQTKVTAVHEDGEKVIFSLENTGDGLTFVFGAHEKHGPISSLVLNSARDYVHEMWGRR